MWFLNLKCFGVGGTNIDFEGYIAKFSKEGTLRFFKFTEPGEKGEI